MFLPVCESCLAAPYGEQPSATFLNKAFGVSQLWALGGRCVYCETFSVLVPKHCVNEKLVNISPVTDSQRKLPTVTDSSFSEGPEPPSGPGHGDGQMRRGKHKKETNIWQSGSTKEGMANPLSVHR